MVETQLCKLRDTYDTLIGRASPPVPMYFVFAAFESAVVVDLTLPLIVLQQLLITSVDLRGLHKLLQKYCKTSAVSTTDGWLKLNFASCVIHVGHAHGARLCYTPEYSVIKYLVRSNMVFVVCGFNLFIHDW